MPAQPSCPAASQQGRAPSIARGLHPPSTHLPCQHPGGAHAALQAAANAIAALNQVLAQAPSVEYMQKAMVVSLGCAPLLAVLLPICPGSQHSITRGDGDSAVGQQACTRLCAASRQDLSGPLTLLQIAQTVLAQQVQALLAGTMSAEAFAAATTTGDVITLIEGATLPGVLLGDDDDDLDLIVWAPPSSDGGKALAIGLGVGLGLGLPLLALAAYLLLALWRRRSQRWAVSGPLGEPMVYGQAAHGTVAYPAAL